MKKHEIFETNPNLKQVHVTSDGQSFYNDNDAKLHAKSLDNKSVELVVNPDQIEVVDEEVEETEAATEVKMELVEVEAEVDATEMNLGTEANPTKNTAKK